MKKQLKIQEEPDYQNFIIGIVSDDRIWKLAFLLNQSLQIQLKPLQQSAGKADAFLDSNQPLPSLFSQEALSPPENRSEYYLDDQSFPKAEICLSSGAEKKLPSEAKPFSAFFFIRYISTPLIDLADWVSRIHNLPNVHSAVDLSNVQNLKNLLP